MRTRFLTRRRDVYLFQIRVPERLRAQYPLSPIRVRLGPIGWVEAQAKADVYAGFLRQLFRQRRTPMTPETCAQVAQALNPRLSEEEQVDRLLAAMTEEQRFQMVLPSLVGLRDLADGDLGEDIGEEVRDKVFDGFAGLGFDRATGTGALTAMMGDHMERSLRLSLTSDRHAREVFGFPPKEEATPDQNRQIAAFMETMKAQNEAMHAALMERQRAEFIELRTSIQPDKPVRKPAMRFSQACTALIGHIAEAKRPDHPDLPTIRRVGETFVALVGDKPVDQYTKGEVQQFVIDLSFVEPNFLKKNKNASIDDLRSHVAARRKDGADGLSQSTIEATYLDRVRSIIRHGCEDADVADPLAGKTIAIPERARSKRKRKPLTMAQVTDVLALGRTSGLLSDTLLPLLAFMTGRREGLLTSIRHEWLEKHNGVWMIHPTATMFVDGKLIRVPFKTDASLKPFVLHRVFEEIGLIDWMQRKRSGWLFEQLAACKDPSDAAQKRMGRLFRAAGLDGASLETFHALRNTRIAADFDLGMDGRLKRLQVGHEAEDIHEEYAGVFSTSEANELRTLPIPLELDLSGFMGLDFDALAACRPKGGRRKKATVA